MLQMTATDCEINTIPHLPFELTLIIKLNNKYKIWKYINVNRNIK